MMATEATAAKPVDVSVNGPSLTQSAASTTTKPDADANADTDVNADAQNVIPSGTALNGPPDEIENRQITDIVDELVNSTEVSVSGGSDTEASRADPSLRSADVKDGHVRTSSAATKPKSFKSVSVNKTFLASKGATNASSRPDSATGSASSSPAPGTTASSASRLKLVAKSGSSLGGSTKTLSSNGKPGAPDGSSVWNKNKPPPTPEPKKLSDEEIMHQYGIHIADRLGPEDDAKGQANWADMEDEEEWAPETITWTDGTQVTLPHVDEHPTSPAPAPASVAEQPESRPKSKSPAPTAPSSTSAAASPSIKSGVLASGKGLVLKGAPEKPTLVAKPPAPPAPVKSPWATLPPIDRASPAVVMELPHQGHQGHQVYQGHQGHPPRPPQRDPSGAKTMTPPLTKEIAADDFSRATWREGHTNPSRELFNSQSGRYEPVFDRRGSRHEIPGRQPSLLQRPPHQDHQGPPDPSAAYRPGGQEGPYPYGRRRGSSNVSGGSGSVVHRLGRPHDMPPPDGLQTRTGPIGGGMDSPLPNRPFSPASSHATPRTHYSQPWQPRHSPSQPPANLHYPPNSEGGPPPMNPVAAGTDEETIQLQKKIMRERREAAMKRRLEEEEREEAAKKERLRLKLEAMGPAPERKSTKKDENKEDSPTKPYQPPPQREGGPPPAAAKAPSSPEKPDIPATVVENEKETMTDTIPTAEAQMNGGAQAPFNQARPQGQPTQAGLPKAQSTTPWLESSQPQKPTPYWGSGPPRNVWAAPGNDRSLGNGTFNAGLGPLAGSHHDPVSTAPHHPAPIGTPRNASQVPPTHTEPTSGRLAPIGPPRGRHVPSGAQAQQQMPSNPWKSVDIASEDRAIALETRARNEAHIQQLRDQGLGADAMGPSTVDTWREVRRDEAGKRVAVGTSVKSIPNAASRGDQRNPSWNNAAGAVARDAEGNAASEREDVSQLAHAHQMANGAAPDYGRSRSIDPTVSSSTSQARSGSRFFPSSRYAQQEESASQQPPQQPRTQSQSPPPPTMEDHPVYSGNPERPHVALPPPRPQVKLPPSVAKPDPLAPIAPPANHAPTSFAAAAAAPAPGHSPLHSPSGRPPSQGLHGHPQRASEFASQQKWQDKINHLMGKDSAPSARSMAVEVSSRHNLDHMPSSASASATVSLPSLSVTQPGASDIEFTTRRMGEECFEEQEMGSLPPVHLPHEAPDALWHASPVNWQGLSQKFRVEASNAEDFRFGPEWLNGKTIIRISTPGSMPKTLPWSLRSSVQGRTRSNPRRPAQRGGGRHPSRGGHRGGRDDLNDLPSGLSSERPPSNRSNRSSFRGRSDNWGRQNPSASTVQT